MKASARVLLYVGSTGPWHMLDEMFDFFREYDRHYPDARFLFITTDDPLEVRRKAEIRGVSPDQLDFRAATREEIPGFMAAADTGIALKRPSFSALASSPTKLGEMLASGIPVVVNSGVGDVDHLMSRTGGGVVLEELNSQSYSRAIQQLDQLIQTPSEIRNHALEALALELGVERYSEIYSALAADR